MKPEKAMTDLKNLIKKQIEPGIAIISDCLKVYGDLNQHMPYAYASF